VGEGIIRRVDDGVRGHRRDVAGLEGDHGPTEAALNRLLIHGLILSQVSSAVGHLRDDDEDVPERSPWRRSGPS
jgi:hypothetical protein